MARFRVTVFDPVMLVAQMVGLQATFYLVAGALVAVVGNLFGVPPSLDVLFDYTALRSDSIVGWFTAAAFLLSALAGALALVVLVGRAKQCLDFAATLHGFHLVGCTVHGGWPRSAFWWALNLTSLAVMALLGEYLCMKRELLPIALAGQDLSRGSSSRSNASGSSSYNSGSQSAREAPGRARRAAHDADPEELEMEDMSTTAARYDTAGQR